MKIGIAALAVATIVAASPAIAQQYKTDIPPAITIPDSVDTRLGTLHFRDGFPDDATVQKVYDNLDFQHGVQAFLTAMPAASLAAIRKGIRGFGPDNQTVILFETLMDARSLFLTANTESIYAMAWLDLKNGPVVVEKLRPIHWVWSMISGFTTSPTLAMPGRTRARAANTCSCRRTIKARYRRAIMSSSRRPSATGSARAASR